MLHADGRTWRSSSQFCELIPKSPTLQKAALPFCSQCSDLVDIPTIPRAEEVHTWPDVSDDAAERNNPVAYDTFHVAVGRGVSLSSSGHLGSVLSHRIQPLPPSSLPFSDYPKNGGSKFSRNVGGIANQHNLIFQNTEIPNQSLYTCIND